MCCSKCLDLLSCCYCFLQKDGFGRSPGTRYSMPLVVSSLLTALRKQEAWFLILAGTARSCASLYVSCFSYCSSIFGSSLLQQCSLLAAVHVAVRQHILLFLLGSAMFCIYYAFCNRHAWSLVPLCSCTLLCTAHQDCCHYPKSRR